MTIHDKRKTLRDLDIAVRLQFARANLISGGCSQCAKDAERRKAKGLPPVRPTNICPHPSHWDLARVDKALVEIPEVAAIKAISDLKQEIVRPAIDKTPAGDLVGDLELDEFDSPTLDTSPAPQTPAPSSAPQPPAEASKPAKATVAPASQNALLDALESVVKGILGDVTGDVVKALEERLKAVESKGETYKGINLKVNGETVAAQDGEHVHACFETAVQLALLEGMLYLVGPAGTGKTFLCKQIAWACAKARGQDEPRFGAISVSPGLSESAMSGWLIPIGDGGRFVYVPVSFVECYERGGVFCADEFDSMDPTVAVFLNSALANDSFWVPQRHEAPEIKRHPDFVFIACANTLGTGADRLYSARQQLDIATLDRFVGCTLEVGYDEVLEDRLALASAAGSQEIAQEATGFARALRATIQTREIQKVASYRLTQRYAAQRAAGWSRRIVVYRILRGQGWTTDERALLPSSVQAAFTNGSKNPYEGIVQ
jgi:MoxR-like ATPase